jgi:hypothetical protein
MLTRTSLTTFELSVFSFDESYDGKDTYQPYSVFHSANQTLAASTYTEGSCRTLTVSSPYFDTTGKHNNVVLRYGGNEIRIDSVTSSTVATGTIIRELST